MTIFHSLCICIVFNHSNFTIQLYPLYSLYALLLNVGSSGINMAYGWLLVILFISKAQSNLHQSTMLVSMSDI